MLCCKAKNQMNFLLDQMDKSLHYLLIFTFCAIVVMICLSLTPCINKDKPTGRMSDMSF